MFKWLSQKELQIKCELLEKMCLEKENRIRELEAICEEKEQEIHRLNGLCRYLNGDLGSHGL